MPIRLEQAEFSTAVSLMDDFTAANIAIDDEKREEELAKKTKGTVDYAKLDAAIEEAKQIDSGVRMCCEQLYGALQRRSWCYPRLHVLLQGNLTASLEKLLNLEKQHRLGEDVTATKRCCTAILDVLYEAKEWKLLNEHILLLAKRRSQLKQVLLWPSGKAASCSTPLKSLVSGALLCALVAAAGTAAQSGGNLSRLEGPCMRAGGASLCAAGHGLHRPHAGQGDADRAHQDAAVRNGGQGAPLPALKSLLLLPACNGWTRRLTLDAASWSAQIFVEIERARLTKQLAKLKEQEGKIDEAADILQEVAVVRPACLNRSTACYRSSAAGPGCHRTAGLSARFGACHAQSMFDKGGTRRGGVQQGD